MLPTNLLLRIAHRQTETGIGDKDDDTVQCAEELEKHIERLKSLLLGIGKSDPKTAGYE